MKRLNDITDSIDLNLGKFHEIVRDGEAWHAEVHGVTKSQTRISDQTARPVKHLAHSHISRVTEVSLLCKI